MNDYGKNLGMAAGLLDRLRQEHGEVIALIEQVKQGPVSAREALFPTIRIMLLAHSKAEEAVLYDRLSCFPEFTAQIRAQRREHSDIALLLERLANQAIDSNAWMETFVRLDELFKAHAEREEALFPAVEKYYTAEQLESFARIFMRQRDLEIEGLEPLGSPLQTGS
jgi:hemerythrin superfamily protein